MARKPLALSIVCALASLAAAAPAAATYPGRDGLIARGDTDGVHVLRADGSRDRLVSRVGRASDAQWGPNGRRIAFVHAGSVWVVNLNDGTTRRVTAGRYDFNPSFSAAGGSIAYGRYDGASPGLWVVRLSDGRKTRIVAGRIAAAEWSPDGAWIAYSADDGDAYLVRPNGSGRHKLVDFPDGPGDPLAGWLSWAPDASELAVDTEANSAACDGCETLYTVDADGSDLESVAKSEIGRPFWAPEGGSIAYCQSGYATSDGQYSEKLQAVVAHGERYLGPTCGTSWQALPAMR